MDAGSLDEVLSRPEWTPLESHPGRRIAATFCPRRLALCGAERIPQPEWATADRHLGLVGEIMAERITPTAFEGTDGLQDWRVISEVAASTSAPPRSRRAPAWSRPSRSCRGSRTIHRRSTSAQPASPPPHQRVSGLHGHDRYRRRDRQAHLDGRARAWPDRRSRRHPGAAGHPGRAGPHTGDALLAGRTGLRAAHRQPGRGSGRSAGPRRALLVREDGRAALDGGGAIHSRSSFRTTRPRLALRRARRRRALVRDDYAPAWWTLADSAGNEVDISTTRSRD